MIRKNGFFPQLLFSLIIVAFLLSPVLSWASPGDRYPPFNRQLLGGYRHFQFHDPILLNEKNPSVTLKAAGSLFLDFANEKRAAVRIFWRSSPDEPMQSSSFHLGEGALQWLKQEHVKKAGGLKQISFLLPGQCRRIYRAEVHHRLPVKELRFAAARYRIDSFHLLDGFQVSPLTFEVDRPQPGGFWEFHYQIDETISYPGSLNIRLRGAGRELLHSYRIRISQNSGIVAFPQDFYKDSVKQVEFTSSSDLTIQKAERVRKPDFNRPLMSDFYHVLDFPAAKMRNHRYELFGWSLQPDFLLFRFDNYRTQARFLKRLAYFVEKEGYAGKLLDDKKIRWLHGWNAHDYRAADLARFYQTASDLDFELNSDEHLLLEILLENEVVLESAGGYIGGSGGLISIALDDASYRYGDHLLLTHEGLHAIFFSNAQIRAEAKQRWASLEPEAKRVWEMLLKYKEYDPANLELSENEYFAYTLTRPASAMAGYLYNDYWPIFKRHFPDRINEVQAMRDAPVDFLTRESEAFEKCVRRYYPVSAGDLRSWVNQ